MIPIPSIQNLKDAYNAVMKVIGVIKDIKKEYEPTQHGSSTVTFYRPGRDEQIERLLNGKFPAIPGTYDVNINGKPRTIQLEADIVEFNVLWRFRNKGEFVWWALSDDDIRSINWLELTEISY